MKITEKNIISYDHLFNGLHQFMDSDGQCWYSSSKAASLIGIKNPKDAVSMYVSDDDKHLFKRRQFYDNVLSYYDVENAGEVLITKNGLLQLLMFSNVLTDSDKHKFAKKFGLNLDVEQYIDTDNRQGYIFTCNLYEILKHLGIHAVKDYRLIHEYRVDLYVPKYNLAIEYYDSNCKSKKYFSNVRLRELTIKKVFDCNFIRLYDIDSDNKNIAKVIDKILKIEKVIL